MGRGGGWAPLCALLVAAGATAGCGDDQLIGRDLGPGGRPDLERYRPVPRLPEPPGIGDEGPVVRPSLLWAKATGGASCAGGPAPLGVEVHGGTPPYTYSWTPADGLDDPTSPAPVATNEIGVDYTVHVTDSEGQRTEAVVTLIPRALPTLDVQFVRGAPESCFDTVLELDASGSTDADGAPIKAMAWDRDGDGTIDSTGITSGPFQPRPGHVVRLAITDDHGCVADYEQPLEVFAKPKAVATRIAPSGSVCDGASVRFDGSQSSGADGADITSYSWDIDGDGTSDAGAPVTYAFPVANRQYVTLTVTDSNGCKAATMHQVRVFGNPVAQIVPVGNPVICQGETVQLDGTSSTGSEGAAVESWAWNLDANVNTVESTAPVTPPFAPGAQATLTVGSNGCFSQAAQPITVLGPRQTSPWDVRIPEGEKPMVDVIFVIDNSASMSDEILAVQDNINTNFAQIIGASQLDYRIIMISAHGTVFPGEEICVAAPLSGTTCLPVPAAPVNGPQFFHYDIDVHSTDAYEVLLETWNQPDPHNFAPNGWSQWVREGAKKVFVIITDDDSTMTATMFDQELRARSQAQFGSAAERKYVWHSIVGLANNVPDTEPWLASHPIQNGTCGGNAENAGLQHQQLSRLTKGLRFPICQSDSFDVVFQQIAEHVVQQLPLACSINIPGAANGDSINLSYRPGGTGAPVPLARVANAEACGAAGGYYVEAGVVYLCPATCTTVQADIEAAIDISGCG